MNKLEAEQLLDNHFESLQDYSKHIYRGSTFDDQTNILTRTYDLVSDRGYSGKRLTVNLDTLEGQEIDYTVTDVRGSWVPEERIVSSYTLKAPEMEKEQPKPLIEPERLQKFVAEHGEELKKVIDEKLQGDNKGISYVSREEVEKMLDDHFGKMEKLFTTLVQQQRPLPLKEKLNNWTEQLKDRLDTKMEMIKQGISGARQNFTEKVTDVKMAIKENINQRIERFNDRIKEMAQSFENKFILQTFPTGQSKEEPQEKADVELLKAKVTKLEKQNHSLSVKLEDAGIQIKDLIKENKTLTQEKQQLQKKMEAMRKFMKQDPKLMQQLEVFLNKEQGRLKESPKPPSPRNPTGKVPEMVR